MNLRGSARDEDSVDFAKPLSKTKRTRNKQKSFGKNVKAGGHHEEEENGFKDHMSFDGPVDDQNDQSMSNEGQLIEDQKPEELCELKLLLEFKRPF